MRRLEIEEVLGYVPAPDVAEGLYLIDILFKVGPVRIEAPILEQDLQPWESRRGIHLEPWQADLILEMSRAYLGEMYAAREFSALAPWPKARNMWKYVQDHLHTRAQKTAPAEQEKETPRNGNRKRR